MMKFPLSLRENVEANSYAILDGNGKWLLSLLHNGEPLVAEQRENLNYLIACANACRGLKADDLNRVGLVGEVGYQLIEKDAEIERLQARIAELEHQAAIGRRAVLGLRALEWSRPVIDRNGFLGRGRIECGRGRESGHTEKCAAAAILRDAEQASGQGILDSSAPELGNSREILDSSNRVRDATKMAEQQARISELLAASDALIERWHTPLWRDAKPTAEYIAALRLAAESARKLLEG